MLIVPRPLVVAITILASEAVPLPVKIFTYKLGHNGPDNLKRLIMNF